MVVSGVARSVRPVSVYGAEGLVGLLFSAIMNAAWRDRSERRSRASSYGYDAATRKMQSFRCAVLLHVYYPDLWDEIAMRLRGLERIAYDLYVNAVDGRTTRDWQAQVVREFPGAQVFASPNLGQDVGGTVSLLRHVDLSRYGLVCKIHTKKSTYNPEGGARWRHDLLRACLENPRDVFGIFDTRPEVTMLGSGQRVMVGNGMNQRECERLCDRLKVDRRHANSPWVAGCMFWCRPYILQALKDAKITQDEFVFAYGHDGTLAHAIERVFGALAASRGEIHWR